MIKKNKYILEIIGMIIFCLFISACSEKNKTSKNNNTDSSSPVSVDIVLTEVTPVGSQEKTYTPFYTFNTTHGGSIIYGGDCSSETKIAEAGDNKIRFNTLTDGTYDNCTIQVKDESGNTSSVLSISEFTIKITIVLSQVVAVSTPAKTYTPVYTFNTSHGGTIIYGGDCSSDSKTASVGDNTISFNALANGTHNNCTIQIKDDRNYISDSLVVESFTVAWITKPLNDTGQVYCGDSSYLDNTVGYEIVSASEVHNNDLECTLMTPAVTQTVDGEQADGDVVRAGQDAVYGRDVTHNNPEDGYAGFNFSKLNQNGVVLADQSKNWHEEGSQATNDQWACVKDNVTGLIWEIKQNLGNGFGEGLHDADDRYHWYDSDTNNNGGFIGYSYDPNSSAALTLCTDYNLAEPETHCNTQAFINRVNVEEYCGFTDWRLPTQNELAQIIANDHHSPSIDSDYFPNTRAGLYWSSPYSKDDKLAWVVDFNAGGNNALNKLNYYHVRLVRGGQ